MKSRLALDSNSPEIDILHVLASDIQARFAGYQNRGADLTAAGDRLLSTAGPPDTAGLAIIRLQLLTLLAEYQRFKHREIFDPAIAGENGDDARLAQVMKDECIAIDRAFRSHVLAWSNNCGANWGEYRQAAQQVRSRLLEHLKREQEGVKQLLRWPD